jgi:hypothetical protein
MHLIRELSPTCGADSEHVKNYARVLLSRSSFTAWGGAGRERGGAGRSGAKHGETKGFKFRGPVHEVHVLVLETESASATVLSKSGAAAFWYFFTISNAAHSRISTSTFAPSLTSFSSPTILKER